MSYKPKYDGTAASCLSQRVAYYIPTRTPSAAKEYRGVKAPDLIRVATNFFTVEFGGSTRVNSLGSFIHPKETVVQFELVRVIFAYTTPALLKVHARTIEVLANDLCCRFGQTSLAYEICGSLYFASPTDKYRAKNRELFEELSAGRVPDIKPPWLRYSNLQQLLSERRENELRREQEECRLFIPGGG